MSDSRSTRRMGRKLRFAVAIVGVALALPGAAVANHTDPNCTPGDSCPVFDPALVAGPQASGSQSTSSTTTDTPSSLTFRFSQADHNQPVVGMTYYVPKGWQFNFASLRPAEISESADGTIGAPATNCDQVYVGDDNDADDTAASLGRAENLAGGVGMTMKSLYSREFPDDDLRFGYTKDGRSGHGANPDNTRSQNPSLAFLNYDGTTANLCLYLYANDWNVASNPNSFFTDPLELDTVENQPAREHIVPVTVTKLASTDPFGWKISFNTTSVYKNPFWVDQEASVLDFLFYINDISGGNWNTVFGQPSGKLVVSKTPATPGTYEFRGIFDTCAQGLDPSTTTACKNNALLSVTRSKFFDITPPPSQTVHQFARITGPTTGGPFEGARWGILRGTNKVKISWNQPTTNPSVRVKGYALTVAIPGDQGSRHVERIITNPTDPIGDPADGRAPCGATGLDPVCNLELTFPLAGLSKTLTGEGKYDISLATIYQDGYRTDQRDGLALCDDGSPLGALCGPTVPAPKIVSPGSSSWSIFITKTAWPTAFGDVTYTEDVVNSETGFAAPTWLILVDYTLHKGAVVNLNPRGGKSVMYGPISSNNIHNETGVAGVISFDSGAYVAGSPNFMFHGVEHPPAPEFFTQDMDAEFFIYNMKSCPACAGEPEIGQYDFTGYLIP